MLRINVYTVLDQVAVQIHILRPERGTKARPHPVEYLHYSLHPQIAHSETDAIADMIVEALWKTERAASERGGWSALV